MRGSTVLPGTPCRQPRGGELPMHRLEVPAPTALPFVVGTFEQVGPLSRASFPHRHTFYEIVHVTGGSGTHVLDLARLPLRPPHLCVITPGQVHHWEDARDLRGSVVLFTDDFLLDHPADRDRLRRLSERPWTTLTPEEDDCTGRLVEELSEEFRRGDEDWHTVLRALLHVLVVRAGRLPQTPAAAPVVPARAGSVADEFTRLTSRVDLDLWSVQAYAEHIGVSPGYLTEAVKAATGRTPSELVRQSRAAEAKRLLARTDLTVRQVADRVGFADAAYFCRFFRREAGVSPGDFRRSGESAERPTCE
ncbi:helix-turn-helix transcriptional regulator [Actinokineospora cianjurensis]|uniref:AraC-like DNA-binding protein n=1 Tax=Actinokineospora cianjurensis TaxID=585224 RepID=A0A421B9A0_9PSEU|nr:AraC family transcriptional regulator [Actinokineospora cianjurensis]RLK60967.1 AraC-like DNA-binding protein [Actinokineospora cianjurensis]